MNEFDVFGNVVVLTSKFMPTASSRRLRRPTIAARILGPTAPRLPNDAGLIYKVLRTSRRSPAPGFEPSGRWSVRKSPSVPCRRNFPGG